MKVIVLLLVGLAGLGLAAPALKAESDATVDKRVSVHPIFLEKQQCSVAIWQYADVNGNSSS